MIPIKITTLPHFPGTVLPSYSTPGSACMDVRAAVTEPVTFKGIAVIPLGFCVEIPTGYEIQVRSRSGLASKGIHVLNSPGTVDSDYRGELKVILHSTDDFRIERGDRIAQILVSPVHHIQWVPTESLSDTQRGSGGFGSTGIGD